MNERPADQPRHCRGAAQPDRRRYFRQSRARPQGARASRRATAPMSLLFPNSSSPAIRRKTWCSSRPSRPRAGPPSRRWRGRPRDGGPAVLIGTPWVEDGKLYNAYALLIARAHRGDPFQGGPAELRRVRRETRVCPRAGAGPGERSRASASASRSARTWRLGTRDVVECVAETGGEILLVPNGSPYWRGKSDDRLNIAVKRASSRPACRSSTSTWSAARTSSCSTA